MVKERRILTLINLRQIKSNWKQFLAVILIAGLAICLFVGLSSSASTLEKRLDTLYVQGNVPDYFVYGNINNETYQKVQNLEEVQESERRLRLNGYSGAREITLLVSEEDPHLSRPIPTSAEGIMLEKRAADLLEVEDGDTLTIHLPALATSFSLDESFLLLLDQYLLQGHTNPFRSGDFQFSFVIDAVVEHPEAVQKSANSLHILALEYATFATEFWRNIENAFAEGALTMLQSNLDIHFYNQLLVKGEELLAPLQTLFDEHEAVFIAKDELPSSTVIQSDIIQAKQLIYVFPVIFLLVSILVILTTTSQIIYRERIQIGTMKALGLSNARILWHYMKFSILLCLIGGVIGSIIGPLLIPNVMAFKYNLLYTLPYCTPVIPWMMILISLGLFIVIAAGVSYIVARKQVKQNPVSSMRNETTMTFKAKGKGKLSRISWSGKIALRNIRRNKARASMVVIGLLGCTALYLAGFGINDTINRGIYLDREVFFPYDLDLTYESMAGNVAEQIQSLEGIDVYEEYAKVSCQVQQEAIKYTTLYVIDIPSAIADLPTSEGGLILSNKVADNIHAQAGDTVSLILDGQVVRLHVDAIFTSATTHGIFISSQGYQTMIAPDEQAVKATNAWVKTSRPHAELKQEIMTVDGISDCLTKEEFYDMCNDMLGGIQVITITLKVFAILLAMIVLYNLALLNFKERSRDIATLKVLGFSQREISKSLVYEMFLLTLLGAAIGLGFGMPILRLLLSINQVEVFTFIYHINWLSYLYSFALTVITSLLMNLWLNRRIRSIPMVDSLKSVE